MRRKEELLKRARAEAQMEAEQKDNRKLKAKVKLKPGPMSTKARCERGKRGPGGPARQSRSNNTSSSLINWLRGHQRGTTPPEHHHRGDRGAQHQPQVRVWEPGAQEECNVDVTSGKPTCPTDQEPVQSHREVEEHSREVAEVALALQGPEGSGPLGKKGRDAIAGGEKKPRVEGAGGTRGLGSECSGDPHRSPGTPEPADTQQARGDQSTSQRTTQD